MPPTRPTPSLFRSSFFATITNRGGVEIVSRENSMQLTEEEKRLSLAIENSSGDSLPAAIPKKHLAVTMPERSLAGKRKERGGEEKKEKEKGIFPGPVVSPIPSLSVSKQAATKPAAALNQRPSAAQVQEYNKLLQQWQEVAKELGGPGARIVVSKPEAKKLIFEALSIRPMTINEVFRELKAVVPPPVLKTCLDQMVTKSTGAIHLDEGGNPTDGAGRSCESSDEFAGSISLDLKEDPSNNLYFVDRFKLENVGSGMLPVVSNILPNIQGPREESSQRLHLNELFRKSIELASMEAKKEQDFIHEKNKRKKYHLVENLWKVGKGTAQYKKVLADQEQMQNTLAELELQKLEIAKWLDAPQNLTSQTVRRFIDYNQIIEGRDKMEREIKELLQKLNASTVEKTELDDGIGRQIGANIKEFEEQAGICGVDTPEKVLRQFSHVPRWNGGRLDTGN